MNKTKLYKRHWPRIQEQGYLRLLYLG